MRIAYLVHFRGGNETGIYRKVTWQADEWSRLGHDVGLFATTDEASVATWRGRPQAVHIVAASRGTRSLLTTREQLAAALLRWKPDVVYARHTLIYPGLFRVVRERPTVFEINSDDVAEFRAVSSRRHRFARLTRGLLLSRAAGLVFVTRELQSNDRFASFGRSSIVLANSVTLADVEPLPAPANMAPRLIFMGHPHSPWHGLDQLELLARSFPGWQFDVVGPSADELPDGLANVVAHGVLAPSEYAPLLASADVAIGTLGLYRNDMSEASPLKVREYLASGLPAIIGYQDTDFPDGAPFLLRVPNRPGGVGECLRDIDEFVRGWVGRRVPRAAIAAIDAPARERARLEFLRQFAAPAGS